MKYKKIYHTHKEPHFLNVLFPTILPYDWLMVVWFLLTFRARKAILRTQGILMLIRLNKMARVSFGKEYLADFYSLSDLSQSDLMSEKFRFTSLINAAEKDEKDSSVNNQQI